MRSRGSQIIGHYKGFLLESDAMCCNLVSFNRITSCCVENRLKEVKNWGRGDSHLDQGGSHRDGEKCLASGYKCILKVEPTGLAGKLNTGFEKQKK